MPRILFVSGFHHSTRARDLAYEFERFGRLVRCDVPAPRNYQSASPYAFIEFRNDKDAENAYYDMHGKSFDGMRLSVQWAKNPPSSVWRFDRRGGSPPPRRDRGARSPRERRRSRSRERSPRRGEKDRSASPRRERDDRRDRDSGRGSATRLRSREGSRDRRRRSRTPGAEQPTSPDDGKKDSAVTPPRLKSEDA